MKKIIDVKSCLLFLLVFLLVLLKYNSMWNYLILRKFVLSNNIIIFIIVIAFLLLYKYKFYKKNIKNIFYLSIMAVLLLIINPNIDFLIAFLLSIFFSTEENGDKKFVKYYFLISFFFFVITLIFYKIGILPSNNLSRLLGNDILVRYSLGFAGINTLFLCYIPIVLAFLIFNSNYVDNHKIFVSISTLLISIFFYHYTLCRTGIILSFLIIILYLLIDRLKSNRILKTINVYSLLIGLLFSCFLALNYYKMGFLNELFSNRLFFWNYYVKKGFFSLFGFQIVSGIPLDNTYLTYYYIDGFISFIVYFIIMVKSNKLMNNNKYLFLTIIIFSIYGLFENNYSFQYNFLLVLQMIYFIDNPQSQSLINKKNN